MKGIILMVCGVLLGAGGLMLAVISLSDGRTGDPGLSDGVQRSAAIQPPRTSSDAPSRPSAVMPEDRLPDGRSDTRARMEQARRQLDREEEEALLAAQQAAVRTQVDDVAARQHEVRRFLNDAARDARLEATDELRQKLAALAEQGDDVAAFFAEEYRRSRGSVGRATLVINALQAVGTPDAREVLKDIALDPGTDGGTLGPRAVRAYAALSNNSGEIAQLLESSEPRAIDAAILEMRGLPLNRAAIDALGIQLDQSTSWVTHNLVAGAFRTDPGRDPVERKVRMLMSASSTTLDQITTANTVLPGHGFTGREMALMAYAGALANMEGDEQTLRRFVNDNNEVRSALASFGLAQRGHGDVHAHVVRIAQQSQDGILRTLAVNALGQIVTEQDRPMLEQIVRTDPYRRPTTGHRPRNGEQWRYPVRDAAQEVLRKLE